MRRILGLAITFAALSLSAAGVRADGTWRAHYGMGELKLVGMKAAFDEIMATAVKSQHEPQRQWRETTADAVYAVPNIPLAGTAGQPGRYTGTYGQGRVDWTITRQLSFALEGVYFRGSEVIERAGGKNSRYLGVELAYGW